MDGGAAWARRVHWPSRIDVRGSSRTPQEFIRTYNLNTEELLDPLESFRSFNDFFGRKLRPGARPIAVPHNNSVCVVLGPCERPCKW